VILAGRLNLIAVERLKLLHFRQREGFHIRDDDRFPEDRSSAETDGSLFLKQIVHVSYFVDLYCPGTMQILDNLTRLFLAFRTDTGDFFQYFSDDKSVFFFVRCYPSYNATALWRSVAVWLLADDCSCFILSLSFVRTDERICSPYAILRCSFSIVPFSLRYILI